jgi:hypothetical protein
MRSEQADRATCIEIDDEAALASPAALVVATGASNCSRMDVRRAETDVLLVWPYLGKLIVQRL